MPRIPLQLIWKILSRTFLGLFLLLVLGAGTVYWQRAYFAELEQKDAFRYEAFMHELYEGNLIRAWNRFAELRDLTYQQAYRDRYRRNLEKMKDDAEYRKKVLGDRVEAHKQLAADRARERETGEALLADDTATGREGHSRWQAAGAWQRGLMLREKCLHYMEMEVRNQRPNEFPTRGRFSAQPGLSGRTPAGFCEDRVPISHDPAVVEQALKDVREGMNYYYFVRLLDDLGLRDSELFPYPRKLDRMTEDFNGV